MVEGGEIKGGGRETKYKKVIAEEQEWIKIRPDPGKTRGVRAAIETGPKGGEYFTKPDGSKKYVSQVQKEVRVYHEDKPAKTPPPGECGYGFGN